LQKPNKQTNKQTNESLTDRKPVWTEQMSQRDKNNRVWEITKWQQVIDPETNEPNIVEIKSLVREKGCGVCYKDCNDQWQITDASWRQTANGFVMDKANYSLEIGKTANSSLKYTINKEVLNLKADSIRISNGSKESILATIKETKGYVSPDNKNKLIYPNAFGEGIDLEFEVQPDGFHQNVIFRNKLKLPEGFDSETTEIKIATEMIGILPQRTQSTQRSNLKDDIKFINHRFANSKILQTTNGNVHSFAEADKQIIEDSGKSYLVESVNFSELQKADYPVVWDYHIISSDITANQVWYADATYYISGNINLSNNAELKIEPGTIIKFDDGKYINATDGKLTAKGECYEYIVFTSKYDAAMGENITSGTPAAGDWDGIYISAEDTIEFCKIGYCMKGISADISETGDLTIQNNIISNCDFMGIYVYAEPYEDSEINITIFNNLVDNAADYGIAVDVFDLTYELNITANVVVRNNTIKTTSNDFTFGIAVGCNIDISGTIENNLICNSYFSIVKDSSDVIARNNAVHECTYNFWGNPIYLTAPPFDTTNTFLGSYF
jgi:hypothetical protein